MLMAPIFVPLPSLLSARCPPPTAYMHLHVITFWALCFDFSTRTLHLCPPNLLPCSTTNCLQSSLLHLFPNSHCPLHTCKISLEFSPSLSQLLPSPARLLAAASHLAVSAPLIGSPHSRICSLQVGIRSFLCLKTLDGFLISLE